MERPYGVAVNGAFKKSKKRHLWFLREKGNKRAMGGGGGERRSKGGGSVPGEHGGSNKVI